MNNKRAQHVLVCLVFFFTSLFSLTAQTAILHYTETTGFNHQTASESLALFQQIGNEHGFTVVQDDDGSLFNKTDLAGFQAVIFSNTSGNNGLNATQQDALEWFVDTLGRDLLGIHAASDTYRHSTANSSPGAWDWYAETLGGSVQNNPNHTSANHVDTIYLIQDHPSVQNIAFPWIKEEEYYYWENGYLNDDIETILEVGVTGGNSYDQQRPVAWYRTNPQGAKIFYTSLGHKKSNFTGSFPEFEQLIEDAVLWFLGCPAVTVEQSAAICQGESFPFDGQQLTEAGVYSATYESAQGCDSTVQLTLTVFPTDLTEQSATICQGESFPFNGNQLTEPGSYQSTFQNTQGCDSTVQLTLTVLPTNMTQLSASICQGESFPFGSEQLTEPGSYQSTFQNTQGCDSTVQLTLTVLPTNMTQLSASICQGESFPFGSEQLTEPGSYQTTFQNTQGCDSTVQLTLTVLPTNMTQLSASICQGESFPFGSEQLTEPGSYQTTFQNMQGCDSTVQLTLEVVMLNTSVVQSGATLSANLTGAVYQWLDCGDAFQPIDGATEQSFTAIASGEYAVQIIQAGCVDTSACFNVIVVGTQERPLSETVQLFPNPAGSEIMITLGKVRQEISLEIFSMDGEKRWSGQYESRQVIAVDLTGLPAGAYQLLLLTEQEQAVTKFVKY